jgi:hypothetical protein
MRDIEKLLEGISMVSPTANLLLDICDIIYSKDYAIMEIEDCASKLNKIKKLLDDAGYSKE